LAVMRWQRQSLISLGNFLRGLGRKPWLGDLVRRQWLPLGLIGFMASSCLWSGLFHYVGQGFSGGWEMLFTLPPTVLANLAMIVAAFWLMRLGLHEDRGRPFAA